MLDVRDELHGAVASFSDIQKAKPFFKAGLSNQVPEGSEASVVARATFWASTFHMERVVTPFKNLCQEKVLFVDFFPVILHRNDCETLGGPRIAPVSIAPQDR